MLKTSIYGPDPNAIYPNLDATEYVRIAGMMVKSGDVDIVVAGIARKKAHKLKVDGAFQIDADSAVAVAILE